MDKEVLELRAEINELRMSLSWAVTYLQTSYKVLSATIGDEGLKIAMSQGHEKLNDLRLHLNKKGVTEEETEEKIATP